MIVLVRDMRFPNYCSDCEFSKPWGNSGTYCSRHPERESVKYGEEKPEWCPIADVPTPHGRLIDGDKVLEIAMEWCPDDDGTVGKIGDLRELLDEIEAMPTVIEAEE